MDRFLEAVPRRNHLDSKLMEKPVDQISNNTFRFIADSALALAHTCENCSRCDANVTSYEAKIAIDDGTDYEEQHLCLPCLRSIPLNQLWPRGSEQKAQSIVNQHYKKGTLSGADRFTKAVNLCDEIRRIPDIMMFLQNETWPSCCGEFTQFVGTEPPEGHRYAEYRCWNETKFELEDFYPLKKLEVLNTMSLFHCLHCEEKYWVFQYSGLLWLGPQKTPQTT